MYQDRWNIIINTRHWLPGKMEGFGRYISEITPRLAQLLPQTIFYWLFDRKPSSAIPSFENVKKIVVPPPARTIELIKFWNDITVPWVLKKQNAHLYFSPDNHLSLKTTIPQILTIHDINFYVHPEALPRRTQRFLARRTPIYLKKATHIITVSHFSKTEILSRFPFVSPTNITVIYNGISRHFKPSSQKDQLQIRQQYTNGHPYFFVLGSLHERKNLQRIIEAFELFKLNFPHPWYLVVTGRPLWNKMNINISSSTRSLILFTGYLSDQEVAKLLSAAHALVFCSIYEGFGLPLVEAFASHVPAITSNTTALAEIGQKGTLQVNPFDTQAIANAMKTLATNNILYHQLVEETKEQKKLFSWDQAAEQLAEIFLKTLYHHYGI